MKIENKRDEYLIAFSFSQIAEEMYEVLLKKDPNDLDTLYNYGRFLWKVGS